MVGIDEVARRAGVSTATVSRALSGRGHVSDAARERVEAAVRSLGYVASASASSLASGRTRNIGVLLPFLDRWFFSMVLSGIAGALMRRGYDITLYSLTADRAERDTIFATFLRRQRVDGVIAISLELDEAETDRLLALDLPVVAIGGPSPRLTTLAIDEAGMARRATEHLIGLGHHAIAHIGAGHDFDLDFRIPTRRREGFEKALADAGIPARSTRHELADFTIAGGFAAATRLLGTPLGRPTAIFAASDEMAIGALLAARELGIRVPQDLSVVGIDGHELGGFFRLTTVDQFPLRQGERAAEAILAAVAGRDAVTPPPAPEALAYDLVVRGTTGPFDRGAPG
ncbi:LacI family DNA-binding transcriptional regulator [Microbacterium deminutum]|uniref:LacI family DNA-binding transcriptional regulator n=1 Tax=Microbacterium deminutum TaxID=344164 RepID=A0ABP5C2G1_9MICO